MFCKSATQLKLEALDRQADRHFDYHRGLRRTVDTQGREIVELRRKIEDAREENTDLYKLVNTMRQQLGRLTQFLRVEFRDMALVRLPDEPKARKRG